MRIDEFIGTTYHRLKEEGKSDFEIASHLGITRQTLHNYKKQGIL